MSQQIKFFKKNKIDQTVNDISLTVTDATATNNGQDFVGFLRNRNNTSAWMTTGSNDAANTEILIDTADSRAVDTLILIGHNFASYTIQYLDTNTSTFVDFSPAINVSANTATTTVHDVSLVNTPEIKLIVTGTITSNEDKKMRQLIITEKLGVGQFEGWPIVKPEVSLNRKVTQSLSGKASVVETQGSYSVELSVVSWKSDVDLTIVEALFFDRNGFLVWPSGGDESQFSSRRLGYRLEDIYFMKCTNEYRPEWFKGLYKSGLNLNVKLIEAV